MSKTILRPRQVQVDLERQVSRLYFPEGSVAPDGDYLMRGGICWPMAVRTDAPGAPKGLGVLGYACLCGRHERSGVVYVFEETPFVVIEHVMAEDGSLKYEGIAPWFNACWAHYFADTFYWHQDELTNHRYLVQTARSSQVNPKPSFPLAEWQSEDSALCEFYSLDAGGKLRYPSTRQTAGAVNKHVEIRRTSPSEPLSPQIHALVCGLIGMSRISPRTA